MTLLTNTVDAILANKLYIPIFSWNNLNDKSKKEIKSIFIQKTHNPYNCFIHTTNKKCKLKQAMKEAGKKPITACFSCKNSESRISCMSKSKDYIKFEIGNKLYIDNVISIFRRNGTILKVKDKRVFPKIGTKWTMDYNKLNEEKSKEQKRLAKLWVKEKNGILIAPPRFGKTLLCAFVASSSKTRVLVLVHKIDLARQFYKDWTELTTIPKNRIKINPSVDEMKECIVSICTYQQFTNKLGSKRLKEAKKYFGLLIVDEVHKAGADKFHYVINSFWAKYRLAVTATPERRDNKQFRNEHTFGPVLAEGGSEQLSCDYVYTDTNWKIPYKLSGDRSWTNFWNKLAKDEERNNLIASKVIEDVKNNYKIMIPVKRHSHIEFLHSLIKKKASKQGLNIAICDYHGDLNKELRKKLQTKIYKGKYDVVIGMDSIISLGFNAPPMSCIYINVHTYRTFPADLYQEYSRVRTKYKNKNKPLIRIFKDIGEQSDKSISIIEKEMRKHDFTQIFEDTKNETSTKGLKKLF